MRTNIVIDDQLMSQVHGRPKTTKKINPNSKDTHSQRRLFWDIVTNISFVSVCGSNDSSETNMRTQSF